MEAQNKYLLLREVTEEFVEIVKQMRWGAIHQVQTWNVAVKEGAKVRESKDLGVSVDCTNRYNRLYSWKGMQRAIFPYLYFITWVKARQKRCSSRFLSRMRSLRSGTWSAFSIVNIFSWPEKEYLAHIRHVNMKILTEWMKSNFN